MTDLQLVKETVKYYTEDLTRRAMDDETGVCQYRTGGGKQCAIGRLIDESKLVKTGLTWGVLNQQGSLDGGLMPHLDDLNLDICDILKDEYKKVSFECFCDLQDFHDYLLTQKSYINEGKKLIEKYEIGVE